MNKAKLFLLLSTFGKLADPVLCLKLKRFPFSKVPTYVKQNFSVVSARVRADNNSEKRAEPPRVKTGRDPYRLNENLKTSLFSENENLKT